MKRRLDITRRDFLNGVALSVAAGSSLTPLELLASNPATSLYYPPDKTGLRGSHPGSFEFLHAKAMAGASFERPAGPSETYDLVVVGGGVSGLSSAHLWHQRNDSRQSVLVLDNHDDFGGHAKRNEFDVDGEHLISYGGSQSLEGPGSYSSISKQVLQDIGVRPERFYEYFDRGFFKDRELRPAVHFSAERYGKDVTLPNVLGDFSSRADSKTLLKTIADYPLSDEAKRILPQLIGDEIDYLASMSHAEKIDFSRTLSYSDFLRKHVKAPEDLVVFLRDTFNSYWGFGYDALSLRESYNIGAPGTYALGLYEDRLFDDEPYIFHFPDGNASIARLLVRKLVPAAIPGSTQEDVVLSVADYSVLDKASNSTRIRLNSGVVDVRNTADGKAVDVVYVHNGKTELVRARHVVMACYGAMIPSLCPELPKQQKEAMDFAVKTPLVYINIAIRNWQAFNNLGCNSIYVPQAELMHAYGLDFPVSMGGYKYTSSPASPAVLHGVFTPTKPDQGLTAKQQHVEGRKRLYSMSFDDYESAIIRQLDGGLAPGGFDVERDIAAITVNRWPHGYAYEYNDLYDPPDFSPEKGPHIRGRQQIGRISIANSDSSAYSYIDGAIDAADRAVNEQT